MGAALAGEREVAEQRGVAEVVDALAADLDDEAGGRVDRALGRRRRVPGRRQPDRAPVERRRCRRCWGRGRRARRPVLADLAGELDDRHDRRAGALGDGDRVADVVGVAVGQQDRVGGDLVGGRGGLRVAGQERVDQDGRAVVLEREGGWPRNRMFMRVGLLLSSSSGAARGRRRRRPACPAGSPRPAGCARRRSRSPGSAMRRRVGDLPVVGLAEPAAVVQRLVEDPLEAGGGVRDDLLGVGEPVRRRRSAPRRRRRPPRR